jgi:UrcA family protein
MRTLATFAAAIATLVAAPAFAADHVSAERNTGQVTVRLADLDLTTAGGQHTALGRLRRAAAEACGDQPTGTPDLIRFSGAFQRCRAQTLETAASNLPQLGAR